MARGYKRKPIEDLPPDVQSFRDRELEALREVWDHRRQQRRSPEVRINYKEPREEAIPRFAKWLDAALIEGLAKWRRTLI